MIIKELDSDTLNDWLDYFDNRAFDDNEEWRGCYCTAFFYPKPAEYVSANNRRREYAKWLIETGRMRGYMAYENSKVVGWVNVNDKVQYPRLHNIYDKNEKVLSIVCFLIEKEFRGKGIATSLLVNIIDAAKINGFSIIEAYPKKKAKSEYGSWNGPYDMYVKNGFSDYEISNNKVVRLVL